MLKVLFRKREQAPPRDGAVARRMPRFFYVLLGIAAFSGIIHLVAVLSTGFAAWFNQGIAAFFRMVLAYATGWLPFSLVEILLLLSPLLVIGVGICAWRYRCESWRDVVRFIGLLLSVLSVLYSLFVFTLGTGYHTKSLGQRMGLAEEAVTAEELATTAERLVAEINKAAEEVTFGEDGFSVMPYALSDMNDKLLEAYVPLSEKYTFIQPLRSRLKPVINSRAMSYTHITGVYSYFTGEANINVYFPTYTVVFTAAHELAHQRGIARENEANFAAFLVTEQSEDPYIRYCGYLNLFEYVSSALYYADSEAYGRVMAELDDAVMGELRAYRAFFQEFQDSAMADFSDAVNDSYLKLNGNEAGTASYGLVVDLAVAYYKQ